MTDYRKEAKHRSCLVRLPGCNGGGTDIDGGSLSCLAHYRMAGYVGGGEKPDDFVFGAWCCDPCHNLCDSRVYSEHSREVIRLAHQEGISRTQAALIAEGKGKVE